MKHTIFDLLLILAIAVGGALAWQTGRERVRLAETHRRLAQVTGDLPIDDPSKVYVMALETGEPLHFAWRVYYPGNYRSILTHNAGSRSTTTTSKPAEFIARVRVREDGRGRLESYTHFSGGSSNMTLGDGGLADLLRGRWGEVRVEQLGAGGVAAIDPDGSAVLLRLTLPDSIRDEALKTLDPHIIGRHVPVLLDLQLGPPASKPGAARP